MKPKHIDLAKRKDDLAKRLDDLAQRLGFQNYYDMTPKKLNQEALEQYIDQLDQIQVDDEVKKEIKTVIDYWRDPDIRSDKSVGKPITRYQQYSKIYNK